MKTISYILYDRIKLEFNSKVKDRSYTNSKRSTNILWDGECVIKEIKKEIEKFLELRENESTTRQHLQDTVKAALRGKCIAANVYIKKQF